MGMDENKSLTVNVAEMIAPIVGSRDMIEIIRGHIAHSPVEAVYLDFANVSFISRSAAHELLLMQAAMHQKGQQLSFINAHPDVAEMIRIVAANRALPQKQKCQFEPERVDAHSLLGV